MHDAGEAEVAVQSGSSFLRAAGKPKGLGLSFGQLRLSGEGLMHRSRGQHAAGFQLVTCTFAPFSVAFPLRSRTFTSPDTTEEFFFD